MHLLVLDMNGLLCERRKGRLRDAEPDARLGGSRCFVYVRPHCRDFIRLVFDGEEGALQFVWDQRWCDVFRNDGKKPIFIKDIRRVYSREYGAPDSVVLVDDDAYKACRNPPHTAIHPPRFEAGRADDALADGGAIRAYLERLAHAPSVPAFIAAHPFPNAALSSARPRGVGESDRCGLTERG